MRDWTIGILYGLLILGALRLVVYVIRRRQDVRPK
jgi:tetrahydromethanopterin S-methyltransferase subunit G